MFFQSRNPPDSGFKGNRKMKPCAAAQAAGKKGQFAEVIALIVSPRFNYFIWVANFMVEYSAF